MLGFYSPYSKLQVPTDVQVPSVERGTEIIMTCRGADSNVVHGEVFLCVATPKTSSTHS